MQRVARAHLELQVPERWALVRELRVLLAVRLRAYRACQYSPYFPPAISFPASTVVSTISFAALI